MGRAPTVCGWVAAGWCSCVFGSGFGFVLLFSVCGVLVFGLVFAYCWFVAIVNCLLG